MNRKLSHIRKLRGKDKWRVYSEEGKNLGTYDSEPAAKERLQQIHYFKSNIEDGMLENDAKDITNSFDIDETNLPSNLGVKVLASTEDRLIDLARWLKKMGMYNESEVLTNLLLAQMDE